MPGEIDPADTLPDHSYVLLQRKGRTLIPKTARITDHDFPFITAQQVEEWMTERGAPDSLDRRRYFRRSGERILRIDPQH